MSQLSPLSVTALCAATLAFVNCSDSAAPLTPSDPVAPNLAAGPWGPETPPFNLEIILRGDGFGTVKFRQPNDAATIIYLDVWVRGLAANSQYLLQRAVDRTIDDNCTSTEWLTLGAGVQPQSITTDETGTGRAQLFRDVGAFPPGSEFDIHFRVIDAVTQTVVVVQSECYQFRISL
jgi:hypothetical protein